MTAARRVSLGLGQLGALAQAAGVALPPGFGPAAAEPVDVHPALVADLRRLAAPDVVVLVDAARPGLSVTAAVAVADGLGASLLRTGGSVVRLSAFPAVALAGELAGVVPAATGDGPLRAPLVLPLADLVDPAAPGRAAGLRGAWGGYLRARVRTRDGRLAGTADAVWLSDAAGGAWSLLEPASPRAGVPQVRLRPAGPALLVAALAPGLAGVLAA